MDTFILLIKGIIPLVAVCTDIPIRLFFFIISLFVFHSSSPSIMVVIGPIAAYLDKFVN